MRDAIGEVVVVRQDKQAARVLVQPADRSHPLADVRNQIIYGRPALRVAIGCDVTLGLVEQQIESSCCSTTGLPSSSTRSLSEIHPEIGGLHDSCR